MLSIGKLFQKFKLWPIEKCEFVFRQNDNDNCVFLCCQPFTKKTVHVQNLKKFRWKTLLQIESCQMNSWLKKSTQPISRNMKLIIENFKFKINFIHLGAFRRKREYHDPSVFQEFSSIKELFIEASMGKFKLVVFGKKWFGKLRSVINFNIFGIFGCQDSDSQKRTICVPNGPSPLDSYGWGDCKTGEPNSVEVKKL